MSGSKAPHQGLLVFEAGDYVHAIRVLLPIAESGSVEAQARVGLMFQLGLGVARDLSLALLWFGKAANKGCGSSAHNIGAILLGNEAGDRFEGASAKDWFRRARKLGFVVAGSAWYS